MTQVEFKDVTISYKGEVILDNVSAVFPQGESTMIVGYSGSGKTSLLNCIIGKVIPDKGSVLVDGKELSKAQDINLVRKNIGMLFQKSGLFQDLTIGENVALPFYEHYPKLPKEFIDVAVKLKLEAVGLRGVIDKYPRQLSGGMERRVALARAVALDPSLILYDEPLTGQDPISCAVLISLISALQNAYGATSVIVSHQINVLSPKVDRICVVGKKSIIVNDTVENVFACQDPYVQQFVSGLPDGVMPFHFPAKPINYDLSLGDII